MEIRFTASVIEAVQCVLRLTQGNLWVIPKEGMGAIPGVKVESPVWCNFDFFSRIKATPIRRIKRVDPTRGRQGSWELERTIEFFHHGSCVAVVNLIGLKIDEQSGLDNDSFWAVIRVGYFQSFSGGLSSSPQDWREVELEVTSLHGRLVA